MRFDALDGQAVLSQSPVDSPFIQAPEPLDSLMSPSRMTAVVMLASAALASTQCTLDTFTSFLSDKAEVTVNFAQAVLQNGSFGQGSANTAFPNATQLPALCAVGINVKSSENSSYNFGLFLPDSTWNERFLTTGNGGLGGGINWCVKDAERIAIDGPMLTKRERTGRIWVDSLKYEFSCTCSDSGLS